MILLTIAVLWFAAAAAPGPNFILITRTALLQSRAAGVRTACGIAGGACVWGLAGFFGVHALFTLAPWLYAALKLAGSIYLIALGVKYLIAGFRTDVVATVYTRSDTSPIRRGLLISIANPQSALSTASLFAATLPPNPTILLGFGAVLVMAAVALVWYSFVACVLTLRPAAALFARLRQWIDRVAGLAFLGFGTKLAMNVYPD